MKRILRWVAYLFAFFVVVGMLDHGTSTALGVLAGVIGWVSYKYYPVLVGIKNALERLASSTRDSELPRS